MARVVALLVVVAVAAATACGSDRATRGEGTVEVVATTVPLADIARNVGGRRVRVTTLVPRDADPHRWRPGPAAREAMRKAELVLRVGGRLDAWADESGAERTLALLPLVRPLGGDPHWWLDPVRVQRAAKEIRNELARADVDGAGYYEAATADFLARLRKLHRDIDVCLSLVDRRARLAVPHAAFAYFADRYAVEFVPPRRATVGRRLWGDTLGPAGTAAGSYLGAMSANAEAIVDALSGGETTCRPRP